MSYKQTHLLAHHKIIKQFKSEEVELIENLNFIDFPTVDFVYLANQALS